MTPVVIAALVVTVVAALRSTWSPCGLSMLSSMTPLSERARGHRFGVTAAWYFVGAVVGGATIGAILAVAAAGVAVLDPSTGVAAAIVAVVVLVAGAADLRIGPALPIHRRQVDEDWFNRYRRWVYASGFGWQIGNGVVTYSTTACLYAAAGAAVVNGDPLLALVLGLTFGAVRGLAVLLGLPLTSIEAVRGMHARLDRWADPSRVATGTIQVVVAVALGVTIHPALGAGVVLVVAAAVAWRRVRGVASAPAEPVTSRAVLANQT